MSVEACDFETNKEIEQVLLQVWGIIVGSAIPGKINAYSTKIVLSIMSACFF